VFVWVFLTEVQSKSNNFAPATKNKQSPFSDKIGFHLGKKSSFTDEDFFTKKKSPRQQKGNEGKAVKT